MTALALGTCVLITLDACGEQTASPEATAATDTASPASDEAQIRDLVAEWVNHIHNDEFAKACELQTEEYNESILRDLNDYSDFEFDCPLWLESSVGVASYDDVDKTVTAVSVTGPTATAMVGMSEWRFDKSGKSWHISYLD